MSDFSDFPASDTNDLEIKKRARRRLVGAAFLAVLAVFVLPQALKNSETPRAVPDMQVSIPERGEPELPPPTPEDGSESARGDIEPDAAPSASGFPVELPLSLPEQSSPPRPPATSPVQPVPEQPATRPPKETRQENTQSPRPANNAAKEAEAARALALLNGTAPANEVPRESARAKDQVFIQIAAYGKAGRATRQAEELKKKGFAAYAEKAGKVTRVRIGPLSRSEGEKVAARLKAQGYKAALSSR